MSRAARKSTKKKATRRRKPSRAPKPSPRCRCQVCRSLEMQGPVKLALLGQVVEVKYRHAEDGKLYTHRFHDTPGLHIGNRGSVLVVHPVTITRVDNAHFIGD